MVLWPGVVDDVAVEQRGWGLSGRSQELDDVLWLPSTQLMDWAPLVRKATWLRSEH
jgi:hypothetical protein